MHRQTESSVNPRTDSQYPDISSSILGRFVNYDGINLLQLNISQFVISIILEHDDHFKILVKS